MVTSEKVLFDESGKRRDVYDSPARSVGESIEARPSTPLPSDEEYREILRQENRQRILQIIEAEISGRGYDDGSVNVQVARFEAATSLVTELVAEGEDRYLLNAALSVLGEIVVELERMTTQVDFEASEYISHGVNPKTQANALNSANGHMAEIIPFPVRESLKHLGQTASS